MPAGLPLMVHLAAIEVSVTEPKAAAVGAFASVYLLTTFDRLAVLGTSSAVFIAE